MINVPEAPEQVTDEHIDWLAINVMGWMKEEREDVILGKMREMYFDSDGVYVINAEDYDPFMIIEYAWPLIEKVREELLITIAIHSNSYDVTVEKKHYYPATGNYAWKLFEEFEGDCLSFIISTAIMRAYKEVT